MKKLFVNSKKHGRCAVLLDDDVYEKYKKSVLYVCNCFNNPHKLYVKTIDYKPLHRVILNARGGMDVDHINGNPLDNRRENLRICTHSQNLINRGANRTNKTGYKGVSYHKRDRMYQAQIIVMYKRIHGGFFKTAKEAAVKYNELAKKYHGEFAYQNKIL